MSLNQHILEKMQIVAGIIPINLATGANDGDWVSMKNFGRCAVVVFKGAGVDPEDPVIKVEQATVVAGSDAKALTFTRIDVIAASPALTALGVFTTATQSAANSYSTSTLAENQAIAVIDIKAEDLDIDGGFDCIRVRIADVGTTSQIGCALYLMHEPRYASATLPSVIVD